MVGSYRKADSENPKYVETLRRQTASFHDAIRKIAQKQAIVSDRLVYESLSELDEGIGSSLRTSVLAALLAIPGILPAKTIERDIGRIKSNAPISMADSRVKAAVNGDSDANAQSKIGAYTKAQSANILARTLFGEGEGETHDGRLCIATTIFNRGRGNPSSIVSVCLKPLAYSCWNEVRRATLAPESYTNALPSRLVANSSNPSVVAAWNDCTAIAADMVEGRFKPQLTDGNYTHYVTLSLYRNPKSNGRWFWRKPGKIVGNHIFFTQKNANSKPIVSSKAEIAKMLADGTARVPKPKNAAVTKTVAKKR